MQHVNVQQIISDADLNIVNCVAKWPGGVHDARILRESPLFDAFESSNKPLSGFILGDSGYMLRDWLMTPISVIRTPKDEAYNKALCGTRVTVERCIGVLKRRWHCFHTELRVSPQRACQIVCACVILHNRAVQLRRSKQELQNAVLFPISHPDGQIQGDRTQVSSAGAYVPRQ